MKRRQIVMLGAAALVGALPAMAVAKLPRIDVFRSRECGCCGAWVEHLERAGFPVSVTFVNDTPAARRQLGMPEDFGSCHSASVAGYVLEGHVPAPEVKRLLAKQPVALGLAVPGMPPGSPGMEIGDRRDPYDVFLIDKNGRATVFAHYPKS